MVTKRYSPPATPCDRVMRREAVSAEAKAALSERRTALDLESWPETDRIMARGYTPGNQG